MGKDISSDNSLIRDLRQLGIKKGDRLLIHSSYKQLDSQLTPCEIVDLLKKLVGKNGSLVMPSFSFSFTPDSPFDYSNSPSKVGIITESFRQSEGVIRSYHPTHSVSCWGKDAEYIASGHSELAPFDLAGPFGKFYDLDFKIVMLGCGMGPNSTLHAVEHWAGLPYCTNGFLPAYSVDDANTHGRKIFGMPIGHRDFYSPERDPLQSKYFKLLEKKKMFKKVKTGNTFSYVMSVRELVNTCMEELECNPGFFLCDEPECQFCFEANRQLTAWKHDGGTHWNLVKLGRAKVNITPPIGFPANSGWGPKWMPCESIDNDLHGRILFFRKGWEKWVLVSLDLLQLPATLVSEIKKQVRIKSQIPEENIIICCTHTHTGPNIRNEIINSAIGEFCDKSYEQNLVAKISGSITSASKEAIPVSIGFAREEVDIGGINRLVNMPDGSVKSFLRTMDDFLPNVDPAKDFSMVFFTDVTTNKVIGGIGHYHCHPIFSPFASRKISADYPGFFSEAAEKELGENSVVLFLQGALGDQMPLYHGTSAELAEAAGKKLAWAWLTHASSHKPQPFKQIYTKSMLTNPAHAEIQHETPLQILQIGNIKLGFVGGEMFYELSKLFQKLTGPMSLLVGLANDELGYLPTADAFNYPDNYEVSCCKSWINGKPGIGEELVSACAELFNQYIS